MSTTETHAPKSTDNVDRRITDSVTIRLGDHPQIPAPMPGLLEGRVTLIAGGGGIGKTTLCEQLMRHMCSGHQLGRFPLPDEPVGGWAMFLEDDASMSQDRSLRVASRGQLEEDRTGTSRVQYFHGRDWRMSGLRAELAIARDEGRLPSLIIVDHLRILIGNQPPGTSPNDWERRNLLQLVELAEEYAVHLVVLTHMNKEGKVSGTTELINCVDAAFVIEPRDDRMYATLKCQKMRLAPETDYALSRKANGTWGFDDEVHVSETVAQGIAGDILSVLRAEGPKTLSELCTHPAVSGQRRGIQQALTRARKNGWVRSASGHWEILASEGDNALRTAGGCTVCGGHMDLLYEGQTAHPGCDVERQLPAVPAARQPEPEDEPEPEPEDDGEDPPTGFKGYQCLRESVEKSRFHPLPVIRKEDRNAEPWTLITEAMGCEPKWVHQAFDEEKIYAHREDGSRYVAERRLIDPHGRGGRFVILDRNGSYPSACSAVPLAPNKLTHTGPLERYDSGMAGIYLIEVPEWTERDMPSPLGRLADRGPRVWVTAPTLRHLTKLSEEDRDGRMRIAPVVIRDSWTGKATEGLFAGFYKQARAARQALYGSGQAYTDYKVRVSTALRSLWLKDDKQRSPFWRPDWRVAMVAEAAVRHWVAADKAVKGGAVLAALRNVDEAVFWTPDGAVPATYTVGTEFGQVKIKGDA